MDFKTKPTKGVREVKTDKRETYKLEKESNKMEKFNKKKRGGFKKL
tara:strand:+ start:733 stop:870 length:138 start_codon:yes stop_codon:yes gene_type:complete